jgi:hypothetical protein
LALPAAAAGATPERAEQGRYGPSGYFAVGCNFSHQNNDDPIVFPRQRGRSHHHTFFGNTSTDAFSTPASLRAAGTTCDIEQDTAAYWVPTLHDDRGPVRPTGATVYYVRRTFEPVRPFPAGLKMIAGDAAARRPQDRRVTSWSCGRFGGEASSTVPTCEAGRRSSLRLQVNFPNCWDGRNLDSAEHRRHMAYSARGACPASHPVEVPAISLVVRYPVAGGPGAQLASGGQLSGHADFVNAWDQEALATLVERYLNGRKS